MFLSPLRICALICLLFCGVYVYAQNAQTIKQLNDLKQKNNLTEWLYVRIDYANAHPQQNAFLRNTQKEAWRQPANAAEQVAWLTLLSSEGYNELQAGDILSSINYYEDAYTYFRKYKVTQFDVVEYVLKPLGNNYTRLGDYERAVFIQQKLISILNTVDDADNIASIYSNMAITYYNMGRYDDAETAIDKGNRLVKNPQVRFSLNNTLADILLQRDELKQAETLLNKNISSQKKVDKETAYWLMGSYTTLGNIHTKTNQLNNARQDFNTALRLIDTWYPGDRLREKANLTAQLGKIERLQHQPQQALALFNTALQILRINNGQNQTQVKNIYGENKLVEVFHEKALTYQQLKQDEPTLENMRYALLATDKIRKEFADNKTKQRLQQEGKELAEEAIGVAYSLYHKTGNSKYLNLILEITEQTKARTLADQIQKTNQQLISGKKDTSLRKKLDMERAIAYNQRMLMTEKDGIIYQKKIDALKFDLSLLDKKYREQSASSVLSAQAILSALPDGLHVLEFFFGAHSVFVIDVKHKSVVNVSRIDSAEQLRQQLTRFINTYYRNGPDAMLNAPKAFYQASNTIYSALFKNTVLQKDERLCIVPDDVLGYLSFDGLITGGKYSPATSQWPFLIRNVTTTYAFSLNTLIKNKGNNQARTSFSGLFITHNKANDKPIIAVKKESEAIKGLVKGDYVYDNEVNTKSFFNAFENASVLHISTHAYLSGANKEPTLDFGREQLFLFELLSRQHQPNLVVLSACRTGDGLLAKGEGIISLSRGFSAIGTPATIAGLWNVNDDAIAQITADIYKGLVAGESSGTALHKAKLNWLSANQTSDAMYLPYYWDSLILMGADTPVHLQAAPSPLWLYTFISELGLLMLAFAFWKIRKRKSQQFTQG
ncbi:MAG: CHAT domain-containing tetratricopeptide repeat protein [Bacteroidota bacterium]